MTFFGKTELLGTVAAAALLTCQPVWAQSNDPVSGNDETIDLGEEDGDFVEGFSEGPSSGTDILSADTLTVMFDARLILANGHNSWIDGGFGKTRFDGNDNGDYQLHAIPVEADIIWQPRFTSSLSGNVSAAWQLDGDEPFDIMEAYFTWIPKRSGNTNFAFKVGMYWPEISLEHATGGAWSTVYTITPSAINSWVGEEVKVVGAEATLSQSIGKQDLAVTAGVFGFNDTSGTLLSFRGWALHDAKSTLFNQFELPPRNDFMNIAQEDRTRSIIDLDDRVGFYGRAEWRPSSDFVFNLFYYDNRGDPEAFTHNLQWGWRTRFWNLGLLANLGPKTKLVAQGMTGTTEMGFIPQGETHYWVDTRYRSAFALVSHQFGPGAISGRIEMFETKERGSFMDPADENEDGWAATLAARWPLHRMIAVFIEGLHVESTRNGRLRLAVPPKERQNVVQASIRFRW